MRFLQLLRLPILTAGNGFIVYSIYNIYCIQCILYIVGASDFHLTNGEMLQRLNELLLVPLTITSLLKIEHFLAVAQFIQCLGFFISKQNRAFQKVSAINKAMIMLVL